MEDNCNPKLMIERISVNVFLLIPPLITFQRNYGFCRYVIFMHRCFGNLNIRPLLKESNAP